LTKLRQILLNLLSNAVKFTDKGEVVLEARILPETIEFIVRDTGIGIAAENLDRIFESFWQVDQSATRRVGGTGLGLSVARKLARLLDGDITVTSTAGVGTTFVVQLPRARINRPTQASSA
jgi:signal transduction histidine kinase